MQSKLLVATSSFDDIGGFAIDTQFMVNMGAPYLLAHGLGTPVKPAKTKVTFPQEGKYTCYAYTINWVAKWKSQYAPGRLSLSVGDFTLKNEIGTKSASWGWENIGEVEVDNLEQTLTLQDLTGYEGRCALLYFVQGEAQLPTNVESVKALYLKNCTVTKTREFDFAICGGGITGACAALAAARNGAKTALVQDRAMIGGNNSSEVRVWLGGDTNFEPYHGVGNITCEFEPAKAAHYGCENKAELYEDEKRFELLKREKDLSCFMQTIMIGAKTNNGNIESITVLDYKNLKVFDIKAKLFSDCTGDATLGALAGADFEVSISGHQGVTNMWYIEDTGTQTQVEPCPWAIDFSNVGEFPGRGDTKDAYNFTREKSLGCWFWESGSEHHPIDEAERARDTNFRAMYGAWDTLHNIDNDYQTYVLKEAAFIAGKRESRRLMGEILLSQADVTKVRMYKDGCIPSTWDLDVHYPDKRFYRLFHEGDAFISKDYRITTKEVFWVPYRCLYSRNINNLFMAGRNVSVSHEALGTVRVMRTCGMMGEVVGYAAAMCNKHSAKPADIYHKYLDEFLAELKALPNLNKAKVSDEYVPEDYFL